MAEINFTFMKICLRSIDPKTLNSKPTSMDFPKTDVVHPVGDSAESRLKNLKQQHRNAPVLGVYLSSPQFWPLETCTSSGTFRFPFKKSLGMTFFMTFSTNTDTSLTASSSTSYTSSSWTWSTK